MWLKFDRNNIEYLKNDERGTKNRTREDKKYDEFLRIKNDKFNWRNLGMKKPIIKQTDVND